MITGHAWKRSVIRGHNFQDTSAVTNLDLREDVCYGSVTSSGCDKPYGGRYKKVDCCCSVVGGGWGNPCQECPLENTGNANRKSQSILCHCFPTNFSLQPGSRLVYRNQTPPLLNALLADSPRVWRTSEPAHRLQHFAIYVFLTTHSGEFPRYIWREIVEIVNLK